MKKKCIHFGNESEVKMILRRLQDCTSHCGSCDANVSQCGWWIPECVSASAASEARWQSKSPYDPLKRNVPSPYTK